MPEQSNVAVQQAYEELYGPITKCQGFTEREMYIRTLGVFILGWEARERYEAEQKNGGADTK